MARQATSEREVVAACLHLLLLKSIFAWRNNTGAVLSEYKGKKRFFRYGYKGSSDILGVLPDGRLLAVECKGKYGKLTPDQEKFLDRIRRSNGVAVVARDAHELNEALKAAGYGKRETTAKEGEGQPHGAK